MIRHWLNRIQNVLLPPTCILCDNPSFAKHDVCCYCLNHLVKNICCCYQCGGYLNSNTPQTLCRQCIKNPPDYDRTIAPFLYQGAMPHLIKELKFNRQYKNARLLGTLFAEQVPKNTTLPDCIIPVPLHKNRYRKRGFNQSIEIARTVANYLSLPLELNLCIRSRDTLQQSRLENAKQRHENIKNAFLLVKPIRCSHVALLDDVMTTGATVREVAGVLKQAGVQKVEIWACARAITKY